MMFYCRPHQPHPFVYYKEHSNMAVELTCDRSISEAMKVLKMIWGDKVLNA
jgi:hypothetical protein